MASVAPTLASSGFPGRVPRVGATLAIALPSRRAPTGLLLGIKWFLVLLIEKKGR
jgi:hypothetical protein